jgi:hypothetical protein
MNTAITSPTRRMATVAAATLTLALAGTDTPSLADQGSSLRQSCKRAGGTFTGEGSIRPTCHDARIRSPFTRQAAQQCQAMRGTFTVELEDTGRTVTWQCDISAL